MGLSFSLTHLHLQSATTLRSSSYTVVGYAAVNAVISVFHTQDGEELPILPNAVPGIKEPAGHRGNGRLGPHLQIVGYD